MVSPKGDPLAQAQAPTRTLTFLFTDVEGSTRLWERHPQAMRDALGRHDTIVRQAIEAGGGTVVKTMGDGFMAAFASSRDGLLASVNAQLALAGEEWPETGPLRVRMGIHTGEATPTGHDYHGTTVNRAARIMAAGHGGQILLSGTTAALVRDDLPAGWALADLGEHTLKGLGRAEHIHQLLHPDLEQQFPALATPDTQVAGLPSEPSAFVGRATELAALKQQLAAETTRLVTLTGPGGIGKTRLAMRAASDLLASFTDGVVFVDLSAATDTGAVVLATARALGIADRDEREQLNEIVGRLREQRRLLIMDNFEQALSAAPDVATILAECPRVKVLATSREPLHVRGEHVLPVQPMALPAATAGPLSLDELTGIESVQLFIERAQAVRPDFELTADNAAAVAEICRRLDGLPLAIELVTGRIGIFSPQRLLERLTSSLDLLKGGARDLPERQRTLRGTIEWSYELLDAAERRLFGLLSVFSGADFGAVESVVASLNGRGPTVDVFDGLASLTNKSLVRQQEHDGGEPRFSMLQTIREYAADKLADDADFAATVRRAHAAYFMRLAAELAGRLVGPERESALATLDDERLNLAAGWRCLVERADRAQLEALIDALWPLYEARGWYRAMLDMGTDMLEVISHAPAGAERIRAEVALRMGMARTLMAMEGFTPAAEEAFGRAMALLEDDPEAPELYPVLRGLASYYLYRAEFEKAAQAGRRILALAEATDDHSMRLEGRFIVGTNSAFSGDLPAGLRMLDEAISGFESHPYRPGRYRSGNDPRVASLTTSAILLWVVGRIDESQARAERALALAAQLANPPSLAYAHHHAGVLHFLRAEPEQLRARAQSVLDVAEAEDLEIWRAIGTAMVGAAKAGLGQPDEGLAQIERGMALYRGLRTPPVFWPMLLHVRAWACGLADRRREGVPFVREALELGGNGGLFAGELQVMLGDLLAEGDVREHDASAERVAAYEEGYRRAAELGALVSQLRAATRRVQVVAPNADEKALVAALADLYRAFSQGLDTAALVEARSVLVDRGALPAD
jgi:predicted ATPase/class 3 adenylate cyclase